MPRPRPLTNVATGRPQSSDYQSLTPRTPHSLAGRAEEALGEIELEEIDNDSDDRDYIQQQAEPLLASSASDSFPPSGYRNLGDGHNTGAEKWSGSIWNIIMQRIPLVFGSLISAILLVLIVISVKWPETLERAIGSNYTSTPPHTLPSQSSQHIDELLISYENYTTFPLLATEYRAECNKLQHGFMHHGDYWDPMVGGVRDVPHKEELAFEGGTPACSSTITYMLDGHVGLLADLALIAQAAALAREVSLLVNFTSISTVDILY
jgi:hypothetical protein